MVKTEEEKKAYKREYRNRPEVKARNQAYSAEWRQSAKGQVWKAAYKETPAHKEAQHKWRASDRGRAYQQSAKRKASNITSVQKYRLSDRWKMVKSKWMQTLRYKMRKNTYPQSAKGKTMKKNCARSDKAKARTQLYNQRPDRQVIHKLNKANVSAKSRSRPNGKDLYVFQCHRFPGEYKIGRAADPEYRAMNLSSGWHFKVKVAKVFEGFGHMEKRVHYMLEDFMIRDEEKKNTEWFRIPYEDLIDKIEDVLPLAH